MNLELEVSDGALVVLGTCPMHCNLGEDLKDSPIWIPKLLITIPDKKNIFIIGDGCIHKKNTPDFVWDKDGGGGGVWYQNKEIADSLRTRAYFFEPGKLIENKQKNLVYVLNNSFLLDPNDDKERDTTINISAAKTSFEYVAERRLFTANVRIKDLYGAVNACLCCAKEIDVGYNCKTSGTPGLSSVFHGRMQIDAKSRKNAVEAVIKDLESNLKLNII